MTERDLFLEEKMVDSLVLSNILLQSNGGTSVLLDCQRLGMVMRMNARS